MNRKAAFSGSFYPSNPQELKNQIQDFYSKVESKSKIDDILGIISPHAGFVYSGQCAAYGFNLLKDCDFQRVVIIAPSHRRGGFAFSVGNFSAYETPFGLIQVDGESVKKLLNTEGFGFDEIAHNNEHSLEVQLPFLQMIKLNVKIIPILFGSQHPDNSKYLAEVLYSLFEGNFQNTKIIISSDLSHYHSADTAEKMDGKFIDLVKKVKLEKLFSAMQAGEIEACGIGGIMTILHLQKLLNYSGIKMLNYTHSGFVSGDYKQVVGYLSSLFYK